MTLLEILSNLCAFHYPQTFKNLIQEEDCLRLQTMPAVGRVQPDPYRGGRQHQIHSATEHLQRSTWQLNGKFFTFNKMSGTLILFIYLRRKINYEKTLVNDVYLTMYVCVILNKLGSTY